MSQMVDVLIVGAGISGIGMAVHMQRDCPGKSFAIVERRDNLGGTWDLFRYPGIRSDSDMHTLGFVFEPWREQKAIADGPSILAYLNRIADERDIRRHIHFGQTVTDAHWSSADARWHVTSTAADGAKQSIAARFIYMGAGYYDYDGGHDPVFEGREDFEGTIIHPQFWPQDFDYAGKKIVVIGSGATAATLVPNLAKQAAHVTMLQRTPTWFVTRPARDTLANILRAFLPEKWAYAVTRFKNVQMQQFFFRKSRKDPEKVGELLLKRIREELGDKMDERHFTPPYGPWEQRLCLVPDSDFFVSVREGTADVVTDHIERFTQTGIQLKSGGHIDADVIITATGLKLAMLGKVNFSVDGRAIKWNDHFYYKGCLFSNVPNLSNVFGYLNASWTLKADIVSTYVCRVLNRMDELHADIAVPELAPEDAKGAEVVFDFSSGYIQRALDLLPQNGAEQPWRLNQDYLFDKGILTKGDIDDGILRFAKAGEIDLSVLGASAEARLEAAE